MSLRLPLDGVRVLDLTMIAAGPYATQLLADMGAEVIKIEGPTRYDRYRGPLRGRDREDYPPGGPGDRPYNQGTRFNEVNRNKLGIALDLAKPSGVAIFKRLAAVSDVVIENYSPRVMGNFGLDYSVLQVLNPGLIMVSMPGFGATGPYRNYVANGPVPEAMSGLQHLTGYAGGPPMKISGWYYDQTNSLTAAFATLVALHHRRRTGRGQHVESVMLEAAALLVGEAIVDHAVTGRSPDRMGNRHSQMVPHGCYRCAGEDAWVVIAVRNDAEWRRLCQAVGRLDWETDERFATVEGRRLHEDELDRLIEGWTAERDHREVTSMLQEAAVPAGAVLHAGEVMDDPHLSERGFFQGVVHPEAGAALLPRAGWLLGGTPLPIRRPAPCFGEHNGHILAELLGLMPEEIRALEDGAVISSRPLV